MKPEYNKLLKLAKFLREEVPKKAFYFGVLMERGEKSPMRALKAGGGCGTVGCAVGWAPACFPDDLEWFGTKFEYVVITKDNPDDTDATKFFGLTNKQWTRLFQPGSKEFGFSGLGITATKEEVADHIEQWVKVRKKRSARKGKHVRKR